MFRSIITPAVILKKERFGEFHKNLILLTREMGLIRAAAYGAYKTRSRLRMATELFSHSRVYLYFNPVQKSYKVTDMENIQDFDHIRGNLIKFYNASLLAEVILRSFGGGDSTPSIFQLYLESLEAINSATEGRETSVTIQFLWRFLAIAGYQPDIDACAACARPFQGDDSLFCSPVNPAFLCQRCGPENVIRLPPGARNYLKGCARLSFSRATAVGLEQESREALKEVLIAIVQDLIEGELRSVRSGKGIL